MAERTIQGIIKVATATAAEWAATNVAIPKGFLCFESDTLKAKVADGVTLYADLPYGFNALSDEIMARLNNAGAANGFVVLDEGGKVPLTAIPQVLKNRMVFVNDIASRDAIPEEERTAIVFVVDASADATVTSGSAYYAWSTASSEWLKLGEQESMDVDFEQFMRADATLDDVADGAIYKRTTHEQVARIDSALQPTDIITINSFGPERWTI